MNYGIDTFGDMWIDGKKLGNIFETNKKITVRKAIKVYLKSHGIDPKTVKVLPFYLNHTA